MCIQPILQRESRKNSKKLFKNENVFTLKCENNSFEGKSVIIATGSKHRCLNLENEERLTGHGVSYCAVCDGPFYANKDVVIVGGGNSAMQEALLLSSYCTSVTMVQNLPFCTGEKALADQINKTSKINSDLFYLGKGKFRLTIDEDKRERSNEIAEMINSSLQKSIDVNHISLNLVCYVCVTRCPYDVDDYEIVDIELEPMKRVPHNFSELLEGELTEEEIENLRT